MTLAFVVSGFFAIFLVAIVVCDYLDNNPPHDGPGGVA